MTSSSRRPHVFLAERTLHGTKGLDVAQSL
jgi:hypothetical protein